MNNPRQENEWTDCPKGQIAQIARYSKSRERQLIVRRVALGVSTFCVLLFAGYLIVGQPFSGQLLGDIYCKDVLKNADAYLSDELDANLMKKIENHLADCESCRKKLKRMKNKKQDEQSGVFSKDRADLISVLE